MTDLPRKRDTLAQLLLIGSSLAMLLALLGAGLALFFAAGSLLLGSQAGAGSSWTLAVLLFSLALVTAPAIYYAWRASDPAAHARGMQPPRGLLVLLLVFPLVLIGGQALAGIRGVGWSLPILHVAAAAIPVVLATALVVVRGRAMTPLRAWGSFLTGIWVSPAIALVLELLLAIPLLILLFLGSADTLSTPELLQGFSQSRGVPDTYLFEQLNALLSQPLILAGIFGYLSIAVPLIEEGAKSMALWFTARRQVSLSLAFMSGAIAGGGYGLFEAFFLAQPGPDWALLMVARAGASIMHMFAAGLTGLGVGYIILRRKYLRGLALYLAAAALHGIWNLAALGIGLIGVTEVVQSPAVSPSNSMVISVASGVVLVLLSAGALAGLWRLPRVLPGGHSVSAAAALSSADSDGIG